MTTIGRTLLLLALLLMACGESAGSLAESTSEVEPAEVSQPEDEQPNTTPDVDAVPSGAGDILGADPTDAADEAVEVEEVEEANPLLADLPHGVLITAQDGDEYALADGAWGAWCRTDIPGTEFRIDLVYGPASFVEEWEVGNKVAEGFYGAEGPPERIDDRIRANADLLAAQSGGRIGRGVLLPQPPQPFVQIVHEQVISDLPVSSSSTTLVLPGGDEWITNGLLSAPTDWPTDVDGVVQPDDDGLIPAYPSIYANNHILDIVFDEEPCAEGTDVVTFSLAVRLSPQSFARDPFVDFTARSVTAPIVNRSGAQDRSTATGDEVPDSADEAAVTVTNGGMSALDAGQTEAIDNLIVLFHTDAPVVSVYNASGELLRSVEFDAQRVRPMRRPTYGSRAILRLDRGEQSPDVVVVFDAATGESQEVTQDQSRGVGWRAQRSSQWYIDLALVSEQWVWVAVNLATGDILKQSSPLLGAFPQLAANESRIVYVRSDGSVWQVDTESLVESRVETGGRAGPDLSLSPDGLRLAWTGAGYPQVRLTNLETSETVELDTETLPAWANNDLLLGRMNGVRVLLDGYSGEFRQNVLGLSEVNGFAYVGNGLGIQELPEQVLNVVDFVTGEVVEHAVPQRTYYSFSPATGGQVVWGTPGGRNGAQGLMAGWMLNVATGSVATFDYPVGDSAFLDLSNMAFTSDLTRAAVMVDGVLFRVDLDGTVSVVTDGIRSLIALCANGDVVVGRDGRVDLLSGTNDEILATLDPARAPGLCLGDTSN